jgi:acetylornithine deacetylase
MSVAHVEPLLQDLVRINSINPDLVPDAPGEMEIARFIARWLEQVGLEVHWHEVMPNRPNVVGILRGRGGGKSLLLNGHIDTVGVAGMTNPLQPYQHEGRLYGRGAYDMKGGLAACMVAIAAAKQTPLRGDLIFTAVMDEEYAGLGTMAIAERYQADAALIAEPTEQQLVIAHKGFVWLDVETRGVAAHGSRPDLGVDAITHMGRFLGELERLSEQLTGRMAHPLLGHGSLHASLIQGGQELSSYPARCRLSIERRTLPGETLSSVEAEFAAIVARLSQVAPAFQATVHTSLARTPLETPLDSPIVQVVQNAAATRLSQPCPIAGVPYWTDAATLAAAGIPTVLFGPTGAGAHAEEESVDLASVKACAEIYLATAQTFCQ